MALVLWKVPSAVSRLKEKKLIKKKKRKEKEDSTRKSSPSKTSHFIILTPQGVSIHLRVIGLQVPNQDRVTGTAGDLLARTRHTPPPGTQLVSLHPGKTEGFQPDPARGTSLSGLLRQWPAWPGANRRLSVRKMTVSKDEEDCEYTRKIGHIYYAKEQTLSSLSQNTKIVMA
jgi:hypothetical protein